MPSLGSYLRELRERRGHSLDEVARATRVSRPYLEALEASAIEKLPAPVITRGFIRAYCEVLGEPHQQALALYDTRAREIAPPRLEPRRREPRPVRRNHGPILVSFVLVVLLGAALFGVTRILQSGRQMPATAQAPETPGVPMRDAPAPAASPSSTPGEALSPESSAPAGALNTTPTETAGVTAPVTTTPPARPATAGAVTATTAESGTPSATAPVARHREAVGENPLKEAERIAAATSAPYRLTARTTDRTWIRVRTEDGGSTEETIPPEQVREWVSNGRLTVSIGNAAGVKLELNGKSLPRLGARGEPVPKLVLPPEAP